MAAPCLAQARVLLKTGPFDLALLDINLPDGNGIEFIEEIKSCSPRCCIVMSTVYDDDEMLFNALRKGADGYLLKQDAAGTTQAALAGILKGEPPLSPAMARRMVAYFHPSGKTYRLTAREEEVLTLLASGLHRREIAQALKITPSTVSGYIKQVYGKLGVNSCAQATLKAVNMGLVDPSAH